MGFVLSRCRRRKDRKSDDEARPLLGGVEESSERARSLVKLANIIGALKAGKLPSQEQLNRAVRLLLASDALKPAVASATLRGYELSEPAVRVLLCLREVLEMVAQVGLEKNGDSPLCFMVSWMNIQVCIDDNLLQESIYMAPRVALIPDQLAVSVRTESHGNLPGE